MESRPRRAGWEAWFKSGFKAGEEQGELMRWHVKEREGEELKSDFLVLEKRYTHKFRERCLEFGNT